MPTQEWRDNNKEKLRKYRRDWFAKNKQHARNKVAERKVKLAKWLTELKSGLECENCKMKHIACLQFHHIDPSIKEIQISNVVSNGWGKERILEEIKKCKVLCANCHLIFHWEERKER